MHPHVARAAKAIQDAGWRVSSIYRPDAASGAHREGRALDVCPVIYHDGGFGPRTATAVLEVIKSAVPEANWASIAENDHVHVELAPQDRVGVLTNQGVIHMRHSLPEYPIGNPVERGAAIQPVSIVPTLAQKLITPPALSYVQMKSAATRSLMLGHTKKMAELADAAPHVAETAAQEATIQMLAQPTNVLYERLHGISSRIAGPVPAGACLRPAEVRMLAAFVTGNQLFQPIAFPFTIVGQTLVLEIDQTLSTVAGLALGTTFSWLGDIIEIVAPNLSSEPVIFTVARTVDGVTTTYTYRMAQGSNLARLNTINSAIIAGAPRVRKAEVTVAAAPAGTQRIVISGLNINIFSANLRHFVPGDAEVDGLLQLVG